MRYRLIYHMLDIIRMAQALTARELCLSVLMNSAVWQAPASSMSAMAMSAPNSVKASPKTLPKPLAPPVIRANSSAFYSPVIVPCAFHVSLFNAAAAPSCRYLYGGFLPASKLQTHPQALNRLLPSGNLSSPNIQAFAQVVQSYCV